MHEANINVKSVKFQVFINRLYRISNSQIFMMVIILINTLGGIAGLFRYMRYFDDYHPVLWIFIPDSPITAFAIGIFLAVFRKRGYVSIFLIIRSIRDTVFTVIFLIILDPAIFLPGQYELGVITGLATHAMMIIECVFLLPYLPKKIVWWKLSALALVLLSDELIDVILLTIPHIDIMEPYLMESGISLFITIILSLMIMTAGIKVFNSLYNDSIAVEDVN